jgi:EAL domain-containing protein (putative c-di-GMP-specific phosphodiesterase class I)
MYQSKNTGRDRVSFYDQEMKEQLERHTILKSDLRSAIIDNQIKLYYQLQVNNLLEPIGAEILVRWDHPNFGLLTPNQFIPIAEESACIHELGLWILDQACKQIMVWAEDPLTKDLVLSVNVSHHQFKQPDFVQQFEFMVNKYQIDGAKLKLELTENIDVDNVELIVRSMHALKRIKGLKLALDDFGTAYSSLSFLRILPIDEIKIDQSFMHEIPSDRNSSLMVKTIADMAANFGFSVIAEGVETVGQLQFLESNKCHAYQGYLFSKPLPLEAFLEILKTKEYLSKVTS